MKCLKIIKKGSRGPGFKDSSECLGFLKMKVLSDLQRVIGEVGRRTLLLNILLSDTSGL